MSVKPFIKWAGGKTQLLSQLLDLAPKDFKSYHEPFLGGGAFFFALAPKEAYLGDYNPRLVNAFKCVQNDLQGVIIRLRIFERTKEFYYKQRDLLNTELKVLENTELQRGMARARLGVADAARFIYINKTCFNGLWRENSSGEFNVPYGGDRASDVINFNEENLLECSIALRRSAIVRCEDFASTDRAQTGDFVYFDPPYIPLKATSFVDYTSDGFGYSEQLRLRDLARSLKERGVHVMLSNSDTDLTRKLYEGFELHEVQARRSVNRNGAARGRVGELIIR